MYLQESHLNMHFINKIAKDSFTYNDYYESKEQEISINNNDINKNENNNIGRNKEKISSFWKVIIMYTNKFYMKYIFNKCDKKLTFKL